MQTLQLIIIAVLYILVSGIDYWLEYLNYTHLMKYGAEIPPDFEGSIDHELLLKTRNYTVENIKFGAVSSLYDEIILLVFIFGGVLSIFNTWMLSFKLPFILCGIVFFLFLTYAKTLLEIPFSLYSAFKIENKYGFNNMTFKVWIADFMKGIILSSILLALLLGGAFWIIQTLPNIWWLPVWFFFFIFSVFMIYVSPYVIEPLFNKFTPLDDGEFENDIRELMGRAGIQIKSVFKMDASKRTKHTNAYFSGIGKGKRIVLYDTLLEKLDRAEILSVLAHEAGHWKKKHILKHLAILEIASLAGAYIAFLLLKSDYLSVLFGLQHDSFFARLVLLSLIASIATWPFSPLLNIISRHFEREADDFACKLTGSGNSLASALVKLSKDNLSNLHPHPLYWKIHYSHPPAVIRIRYLKSYKNVISA